MISQVPERDAADYLLMQKCLNGDEQAWQTLIDKYQRLVFSIALHYGGSDKAVAIFESIWLTSLESLGTFEPDISFVSWLTVLSLRAALGTRTQDAQVEQSSYLAVGASLQIDPEILRKIEQEQIVRECIDALSPTCREVVRTLFFTDRPAPCSHLSTALGLPLTSTAAKCLHDLLGKLMASGFMDWAAQPAPDSKGACVRGSASGRSPF